MTRILSYIITGFLISCTQQIRNIETVDSLKTIKPVVAKDSTVNTETKSEEEDCVFNNDYKRLTSEWLAELRIKNFIWKDNIKAALVPKGQDTVFVSRGGCSHSGLSVELKLENDNHLITDSSYWIKKALDLAIEYQMKHYEQMIKENRIRKTENGKTTVWYEIDDDKEADNLEYTGIEISQNGLSKKVSISEYFN
jgi:hypothetical protein